MSIASSWPEVAARYDEPHRRYHSRMHLDSVLTKVDELLALYDVDDPEAVRLAALFHDAVYDPLSSTNEADSAALAGELLAGRIAPERVALVQRLVIATIEHRPTDMHEAVLIDADLASLGADRDAYFRAGEKVRAEYSHLDDETWADGRKRVIRSFLDRPSIYTTAKMAPLEAQARANMAAELETFVRS